MSKSSLLSLGRTPNVALVGTGWAVKIQLPAFKKAGLNVVALWARTPEKAKKLGEELKIDYVTSDYQSLLKRSDVDVISIVTPPFAHKEMAIEALKAGKHVICDKPTALNSNEALEMLNASNASSSQLSIIDHELRFLPTFRKLKELISQGKCGKLIRVEGKILSNMRLHTKNWNWWSQESKGGGMLGAVGSHLADSLSYFTGQKIVSVFGNIKVGIPEREDEETKEMKEVTADDDAFVQLKFANGLPGQIQCSAVRAGKYEFSFIIHGTAGVLHWDVSKLYWISSDRDSTPELILSDELESIEQPINTPWGKGSIELGKALLEAATKGNTFLFDNGASFVDGLRTQTFLDTVRASSKEGVPKELPQH